MNRGKRHGFRSGNTIRKYQVRESSQPKRQQNIILLATGIDGLREGAQYISLDKHKRWELLDPSKSDSGQVWASNETEGNDYKNESALKEYFAEERRIRDEQREAERLAAGLPPPALPIVANADPLEEFREEYRISSGGRDGVMISKRRAPGKRGVRRDVNEVEEEEKEEEDESSEPEAEEAHVCKKQHKRLVVETAKRKLRYHLKRNPWAPCSCCEQNAYKIPRAKDYARDQVSRFERGE